MAFEASVIVCAMEMEMNNSLNITMSIFSVII